MAVFRDAVIENGVTVVEAVGILERRCLHRLAAEALAEGNHRARSPDVLVQADFRSHLQHAGPPVRQKDGAFSFDGQPRNMHNRLQHAAQQLFERAFFDGDAQHRVGRGLDVERVAAIMVGRFGPNVFTDRFPPQDRQDLQHGPRRDDPAHRPKELHRRPDGVAKRFGIQQIGREKAGFGAKESAKNGPEQERDARGAKVRGGPANLRWLVFTVEIQEESGGAENSGRRANEVPEQHVQRLPEIGRRQAGGDHRDRHAWQCPPGKCAGDDASRIPGGEAASELEQEEERREGEDFRRSLGDGIAAHVGHPRIEEIGRGVEQGVGCEEPDDRREAEPSHLLRLRQNGHAGDDEGQPVNEVNHVHSGLQERIQPIHDGAPSAVGG